jgi:hypothetical protein
MHSLVLIHIHVYTSALTCTHLFIYMCSYESYIWYGHLQKIFHLFVFCPLILMMEFMYQLRSEVEGEVIHFAT